jgi:signal transduction histidine kinase/ActR/RegA family two-component response regulator
VDRRRPADSGRDLGVSVAVIGLAAAAIVSATTRDFQSLHAILDTSAFLISGALALVLRDLGKRTRRDLLTRMAAAFGVVALFELVHVLTSLGMTAESAAIRQFTSPLYPGTWPPAAYLLAMGLGAALWLKVSPLESSKAFAAALLAAGAWLMVLFQWLPPYTEPPWYALTRTTVIFVPLLWGVIGMHYWRRYHAEGSIATLVGLFTVVMVPANCVMVFSMAPADSAAMIAHAGKVVGELFLLFGLTRMGARELTHEIRERRDLARLNEALEVRVTARTAELGTANAALRAEIAKTLTHLSRMELLNNISRAIGERQDIASIFEVVVANLEEHLPVDLACVFHCGPQEGRVTVGAVGPKSAPLALEVGLQQRAAVVSADDGLGLCASRGLVYQPEVGSLQFPLPQRLARGGLRAVVVAPLLIEHTGELFGALLVARRGPDGFSASDREFLRQLGEHVALATNHARLYTDLQAAYDDLRLTQQRATQHERLRALGQMASGIAHDINNAISPVTLYTEALLNHEAALSPRGRKQLETIQRAIDDVAQTVSRMGEFYRRHESLELRPVHPNKVLQQVLDMTRARWSDMAQQRGVVIDTTVEECIGDPVIMAVESEIREALINLVLNASDAMAEGGTLTLRTRLENEPGKSGEAQRVIVEVSDTGSGMDEATRLRCFEPFFTTKGERGSGLGLAMVYGIVQRHGGFVDIVSSIGKGTTFGLVFPIAHAVVGAASVGSRIVAGAEATRILLVDDEPRLLLALSEALKADGHFVQTAPDGQAAIDAFLVARLSGAPFRVVITDLGMPHMDGHQVAASIRASAPATTILMLTGWGKRLAVTGAMPPNVDRVLGKPPNMTELREAIALRQENPDALESRDGTCPAVV